MSNEEHLKTLKRGVGTWNEWRNEYPEVEPDLALANLSYPDLRYRDLSRADLSRTNLSGADLSRADLKGADLRGANLSDADLKGADLKGADLKGADLRGANLFYADLKGADLTRASVGWTNFANTDLSKVEGLDSVVHRGPSTIGIDTLYKSDGKIPEPFLRGCGVPGDLITFIPSFIGSAIQFYSCFISYSTKDEEFARRLQFRLRDEKLRVWFAAEDVKSGEKLYEQIQRAIQLHDRLLLILSEHSLKSEWVMTEIRNARKEEIQKNRRKLFPIRLVDYGTIKNWECFDADTGKDLAVEVREYFIPDFSNWKDHDSFEQSFVRLLRDLRAVESSS